MCTYSRPHTLFPFLLHVMSCTYLQYLAIQQLKSLPVHTLTHPDMNVLTYSLSTEANCATLSRVHERCLRWAERHGITFTSHKYELIHFSIKTKRHNLTASIDLRSVVQGLKKSVQVLKV